MQDRQTIESTDRKLSVGKDECRPKYSLVTSRFCALSQVIFVHCVDTFTLIIVQNVLIHDLSEVMMDKHHLDSLYFHWVHYGADGLETQAGQSTEQRVKIRDTQNNQIKASATKERKVRYDPG